MAQINLDTLRERGYRQAMVDPRVEMDPESPRATLLFTVQPGPRTTIRDVSVVGDPMMSNTDFLDRLDLAVGVPYEPEALNTRIAGYIDERRARGFYEARVTPSATFDDGDQTVRLTLAVVFHFSLTDGDDLSLLRLFLGRVGNDDPADLLLGLLDTLNDDAVV